MGITYVDGIVTGPTGKQATLEFLVDSGAMYTLLPYQTWRAIDLTADQAQVMSFSLADGTRVGRRVSECRISLPQGQRHTPVILGEPGDDQPLLGVVTLEEFGLMLNPFSRTLEPMRMLLT